MEAQRLTNEHGESVGVYMDMAQYEAALKAQRELDEIRREIEDNARTIRTIENLVLEIFDGLKERGLYEDYLASIKDSLLARGDSPERAERLVEMLENVEARRTLEIEIEEEDDFVPWSEAKERIQHERTAS